jgi:hypothetical protein
VTLGPQIAGIAISDSTPVLQPAVQIALTYWCEVKLALTDKELTFTTEKIIADHIRPAAYTLTDDFDQKLCTLYKQIIISPRSADWGYLVRRLSISKSLNCS